MRLWNAIFCGAMPVKKHVWNYGSNKLAADMADDDGLNLNLIRSAPVVLVNDIARWLNRKEEGPDTLWRTFCARLPFPLTLLEWEEEEAQGQGLGVIAIEGEGGSLCMEIVASRGKYAEWLGRLNVPVSPTGDVGFPWRWSLPAVWEEVAKVAKVEVEKFTAQLDWRACIAMAALTFMNCRNVEMRDALSTKEKRAFERRRGCKPARYHVLDIKGVRSRAGTGSPGPVSLSTALHWCRGHFKTFTGERPMFGKLSGRYWWTPQVRGDHAAGLVTKDYRVKP